MSLLRSLARILVALVVASCLGRAVAKPKAKAEPLHRAAIPDGDGWWCYELDNGQHGCMRSSNKCQLLESTMARMMTAVVRRAALDDGGAVRSGEPCHKVPAAWVRTGMAGTEWRYVAAPTKEQCDGAPSWGQHMYGHESSCELWHE